MPYIPGLPVSAVSAIVWADGCEGSGILYRITPVSYGTHAVSCCGVIIYELVRRRRDASHAQIRSQLMIGSYRYPGVNIYNFLNCALTVMCSCSNCVNMCSNMDWRRAFRLALLRLAYLWSFLKMNSTNETTWLLYVATYSWHPRIWTLSQNCRILMLQSTKVSQSQTVDCRVK